MTIHQIQLFNDSKIDDLECFKQLEADVRELNDAIATYNQIDAKAVEPRKKAIKIIYILQREISHKYPSTYFSKSASYQLAFHIELFNDLKRELQDLGIVSMHESTWLIEPSNPANEPPPIADLLANLPPEQVQSLACYFSQSTKENTALLFKHCSDFFSGYTLDFLNIGNSITVKLTSVITQKSYILQMATRFSGATPADAFLRNLSWYHQIFTTVYAERQITFQKPQLIGRFDTVTNWLKLSEFCPSGSLDNHRKVSLGLSVEKQVGRTLYLFKQMAEIFLKLQENGIVFLDGKISNWLLDHEDKLRIGDTKSLMFSDEVGELNPKNPLNQWLAKIQTPSVNPPEIEPLIKKKEAISVDKLHGYLLAKNIYIYMSGKDYEIQHDGKKYNFSAPIFKTTIGKQLKTLIIQLIQPEPHLRLSLAEAVDKLRRLFLNLPENRVALASTVINIDTTPRAMDTYQQQVRLFKPATQSPIVKDKAVQVSSFQALQS